MKKLKFNKGQTCGVLLAVSIVLTACQKEEPKPSIDNANSSQTSVEELFPDPSEEAMEEDEISEEAEDFLEVPEVHFDTTLDLTDEEKKEMLEQKALLETELQENPTGLILGINDLFIIDNKVNGKSGYSVGVVAQSAISDKSLVYTLGEEENVYVYRDGDAYNTDYIMIFKEVVSPNDYRLKYQWTELEELISKFKDYESLVPCSNYSKDGRMIDTENIPANGIYVCDKFDYTTAVTSTKPKIYIYLVDEKYNYLYYHGLGDLFVSGEGHDLDFIFLDSSNYYYCLDDKEYRYNGQFSKNPLVPINEWLSTNGYDESIQDTYSADDLNMIEEKMHKAFTASTISKTLNVTGNERIEMLERKEALITELEDGIPYVSAFDIYVINNAVRGEEGYSIGIYGNSHISDKGLVVTLGEESNVYVFRDGDRRNTTYLMQLVDIVKPEEFKTYYTCSELEELLNQLNSSNKPLISCETYSYNNDITNPDSISASGVYICDGFNYLEPTSTIFTKPKVFIHVKEDDTRIAGMILDGLMDSSVSGEYFRYDRVIIYYAKGQRFYKYFYDNDEGTKYQGEFSQNPLVSINEWLIANGYEEYVKDSYSLEDLEEIEKAIKAQILFTLK